MWRIAKSLVKLQIQTEKEQVERYYLEDDFGFGEPKKVEFRLSGTPLSMMEMASGYCSGMNTTR